jgi:2-polyprenyl-3-methyl-5-hydroxy-6-metoxy-1,4-benzoquinol methylase
MPDVLSLFSGLPLKERFHVRARELSAPLGAVAERVPGIRIADIGCGHGLLAAHLAADRKDRTVIGVDPDERKIAWARQALGGLTNVELRVARVEELSPGLDGALDAVVVADVMYLLPVPAWGAFLSSCRRLLKPGGRLLLKEVEARSSWKYAKILAQENVMVRLLGRTKSSGGLNLKPRAFTEALLRESGFAVRPSVDLSRGYSTPHVLFEAEAP